MRTAPLPPLRRGAATITASYEDSGTTYTGSCEITVVAKAVTKVEVNVTLSPSSLKPNGKATASATAKAVYNDGSEKDVSGNWDSSDKSVATVDANGSITAVSKGTTEISYTATEDSVSNTGKATLTVTAGDPTGLTVAISPKTLDMIVGSSQSISATVTPTPADASTSGVTYEWKSSNPSVASVSGTNATTSVEPKSKGTATITVTAKSGSLTATNTCTVTVEDRMAGIDLSPSGPFVMDVGQSKNVKATAEPDSATVTWTSENEWEGRPR